MIIYVYIYYIYNIIQIVYGISIYFGLCILYMIHFIVRISYTSSLHSARPSNFIRLMLADPEVRSFRKGRSFDMLNYQRAL